jgi:hypothetical protein
MSKPRTHRAASKVLPTAAAEELALPPPGSAPRFASLPPEIRKFVNVDPEPSAEEHEARAAKHPPPRAADFEKLDRIARVHTWDDSGVLSSRYIARTTSD